SSTTEIRSAPTRASDATAVRRTAPARSQQFSNRGGSAVIERIRDLDGPPDRRIVFLCPIDAEGFVDGGENIAHAGDAAGDVRSGLVACADDLPAFDSAATHHQRPAGRIVIAPAVRIDKGC